MATKKPKPVVVSTLVDPAIKKRWDALSKIITRASKEEALDFDEKWEAVADIVFSDPPLYLAGGFSTDSDFFQKYLHVDRFTGLRKARVARFANAKQIEQLGDTKIEAVLDYLEAKTGGPITSRLPVALDDVKVPVEREGKTANLPLAEVSREQLRAATRALKAKSAKTTASSPRGASVQAAIAKAGLKVQVSVRRDSLDLRAIAFDDLPKLGALLSKLKLPPATGPR